MTDATVTGNLLDALGSIYNARGAKMWITFNTENGRITDENGSIRAGAGRATVLDDGAFTVEGIPVPAATSNPTSFQVKIHYEISRPVLPETRGVVKERGDFGWMTITGDALLKDLEEEQYVPPEYLTTVTTALQAYVDSSQAAATTASAGATTATASATLAQTLVTSDLGTTDGQTRALIEDPNSQAHGAVADMLPFGNVRDYGATGDGATNDTAALNAATANGGLVYVPDGTYLCDGWVISDKTHLVFAPGAVIKQRVAPTLSGGVGSTLRFTTGSDGSIIENVRIDGNRTALAGSFTPGTFWLGLRVEGLSDISVRGGEIYNVMCHGAYFVGAGSNLDVRGLRIHDSAQALVVEAFTDSIVDGVYADNINNAGYSVWQHGFEIRELKRCTIRNLRLTNFAPDIAGRDNLSLGLDASRLDRDCILSDIYLDGYDGTGRLGVGMVVAGATGLSMSNIHVTGYHGGVTLQGVYASRVDALYIDGELKTSSTHGLTILGAGYDQTVTADNDTSLNAASRDLQISNSTIKMALLGVQCSGSDVTFEGVTCQGNTQYGFLFQANTDNSSNFPGQTAPAVSNVALVGCTAVGNGYSGLFVGANAEVAVNGGRYINNGQTIGAPDRTGIFSQGQVTVVGSPSVHDDQSWSKTLGGSILPATYAAGTCWMQMLDPSKVYVGQKLVIKLITGAADATARVLDMVGDNVLIDYAGTVGDNLTALAGTVAISGNTLTGTGTAFTAALKGRSWIKVAGAYYLVIAVASNTSATLYQSGTVAAGATASRVGYTVDAIPSQQIGVLLNGTFGATYVSRIASRTNVSKPMDFGYAASSAVLPGSILTMSAAAVAVAGSSSPALIGSIPPGFRAVGVRVEITTAISGGGATTYDLKMYDNGALKETYVTGQSLAVGASQFYAAGTQIGPGPGVLHMFINGGVPTAGLVNAEIALERCGV